MFRCFLLASVSLISGCTSDLERCRQLDQAGDFKAAVASCEKATKITADSDQATALLSCVTASLDCTQDDGDLETTIKACETAVAQGGTSKPRCSTDAAEKLKLLGPKLAQQKAKAVEAERLAGFRSKVKFSSLSSTEVYSGHRQCVSNGQPPEWAGCRSADREGEPGDEQACEAVARAAGCQKEKEIGRTWCCPRLP